MSKNSLGRELPEQVGSYRVRPYEGAYQPLPEVKPVVTRRTAGHRVPGGNKLVPTLKDAIIASGLKDGMTISFHHSFREGDKVMQIRNNYDIVYTKDDGEQGVGVYNGDIGTIEMIDRPSRSLHVRYDDRVAEYTFEMLDQLELAYAVTVHKSQGSEFDAVVMPVSGSRSKLFYRNLLYTAVTRAKKLLVLVGQASAVAEMVHNDRKTLRYTNLGKFLREAVL